MTRRLKSRNGQKAIDMNTNGIKIAKRLLIAIVILGLCGTVLYLLWIGGAFLPRWITWEEGSFQDTSGNYEILVQNKIISVTYQDSEIWTSPKGVLVQKALSCDIDHDDRDELLLLCWKQGRFGKHKPFWVEKDERKWSQHIFVYEYNDDAVRPKWMSSYIGQDVVQMTDNGKEAPFKRLWLMDLDGTVTSWFWDSWGFTREDTDISFVAFGDLIAHEPIYRYGLSEGNFDFLFENVKNIIDKSDIAVINQETPLTNNPDMYGDYPRFGTPVGVGEAIVDAGFDAVTCATNHALDRGVDGVRFTRDYFAENDVACLGIQSEEQRDAHEVIVRNGVRFAMLNYTYGTNGIALPGNSPNLVHLLTDEDKVRKDIEKARSDADFVIVFAHWGTEDAEQVDVFQEKWTQIFLDSGVDVVIGTHPHALQPYEVLTDDTGHKMLIYYSIGNFVSAQPEKTSTKGGMAAFTVSLTSDGYQITEYSLHPLTITWLEGGKYTVMQE